MFTLSSRRVGLISVIVAALMAGCTAMPQQPTAATPTEPEHPYVKVEGNDGSILTGQLMNGTVMVDCGQGELTLLTDHIYSLTFDKDGDSVMSPSVKVFGKVQETEFRLKNEHGVFRLLKQNLRSIQFASSPPSSTNPTPVYASPTHAAGATSNP